MDRTRIDDQQDVLDGNLVPHLRTQGSTGCSSTAPIFATMENLDLVRRLRRLRRTVDMLQTDLRHGHLNQQLIAEIEKHMEHGIATEPRCAGLSLRVDALRESTLTPRPELHADTIRACEKLKYGIDGVVSVIG